MMETFRQRMVEEQLLARGIHDERVCQAFLRIPREYFVPNHLREQAYEDQPIPIGFHQTISQPYIVALMTTLLALRPTDKVLEIGTGSGYQAAIIATLASSVTSCEIIPELAEQAKSNLSAAGIHSVHVVTGDLSDIGEQAYDKIIITAGTDVLPLSLTSLLKEGGLLVVPLGSSAFQELCVYEKQGDHLVCSEQSIPVRFVPLTGSEGAGWH